MNKWVGADARCWGRLRIGHLRKSTDMIGDCPTPKEAQRLKSEVVVRRERIGRRRHTGCRVREAGRRHKRDRWHPRPLVVSGRIVEREKRRSILPATGGVAVDLETTAVRRQAGIVGMAGATGLAGLPGEAWQSSGRRCKLDHQESSNEQGRHRE